MYTQWYTNPNPNANPKVCSRFTLGKYLGREGDLFILFFKFFDSFYRKTLEMCNEMMVKHE